jgi:small subunit ribosomal protein S3Ae
MPLTFLHLSLNSISMPESIPLEIERRCQSIFPLQNVFIRKVKVLKKPKFDLTKLMEMHGDTAGEDTGAAVDKIAAETTVKKLAGAGGRL